MKYVVKGAEGNQKKKREPKNHDKQSAKAFVPVCLNEETDSIAANKARKHLKEAWLKGDKE